MARNAGCIFAVKLSAQFLKFEYLSELNKKMFNSLRRALSTQAGTLKVRPVPVIVS
jgi:hypothetical protein